MLKAVPLFLVMATAFLLSACGGGSGEEAQSALLPEVALPASADHYSQDVSSMTGKFTATFTKDGISDEMQGKYSFEAPDRFYMTFHVLDKDLEYLMLPPDFYVYLPNGSWYWVDTNALGINFEALKKYVAMRGPVNYGAVAKETTGISKLPDEDIDGKAHLHYGGDADFDTLADKLPEGIIGPADLEKAKVTIKTIRRDIWIDKETYLPRRFNMAFVVNPEVADFRMEMSVEPLQYNRPVDIPAAPSNAQLLSELTTGQ